MNILALILSVLIVGCSKPEPAAAWRVDSADPIAQTVLTSPVAGNEKAGSVDTNVLVKSTDGILGRREGRFRTKLYIDHELMGVVSVGTIEIPRIGKTIVVNVIRGMNGTRIRDHAEGTSVFIQTQPN